MFCVLYSCLIKWVGKVTGNEQLTHSGLVVLDIASLAHCV